MDWAVAPIGLTFHNVRKQCTRFDEKCQLKSGSVVGLGVIRDGFPSKQAICSITSIAWAKLEGALYWIPTHTVLTTQVSGGHLMQCGQESVFPDDKRSLDYRWVHKSHQ